MNTEKEILTPDVKQIQNHGVQKELFRRWMSLFMLELVVYTLCVAVMSFGGYVYCTGRIWYGTEPYYGLLHVVGKNFAVTFVAALLLGCIAIACLNFYKIAHLTEQLTDAVGSIYRDSRNEIKLPHELKEEENQLNRIRLEAAANRQEAHEAQQRKNDMLMYMAHDLKTPLTSVIGYISLLNDETDISEKTRKRYLETVLKKAEHLEELINGFFEITRFNFSHMILEKSYVNMSVMVNQLLCEFKPLFDEKGLWFTLETKDDIQVYCDVEKMERVFDNLFKNVANYSYPNTEIRVVLTGGSLKENHADEDEKTGMRLVVENHGRTIPPEKLSRLFEQFFRLDSSRASSTGGSGLGLAVVQEIVHLHGGEVSCESENEIIRFVVELP